MTCWCGEKLNGRKKHRERGEDPCPASQAAHIAYRRDWRNRNRDRENLRKRLARAGQKLPGAWVPGSDIELPEVDPL